MIGKDYLPALPVEDAISMLSLQQGRKLELFVRKPQVCSPGKARQIGSQYHSVFIVNDTIAVYVPVDQVTRLQVLLCYKSFCVPAVFYLLLILEYPGHFI